MASRLSLGTRIRCQSLRLRRPLWASEIDSLRGQAARPTMPIKQNIICLMSIKQMELLTSYRSSNKIRE
jgi:hypothetical protein